MTRKRTKREKYVFGDRKICGLYTMGYNEERIANVLSVSIKKVEEVLVKHKLKRRKKQKESEEEEVDLSDLSGLLVKIGRKKLTAIIEKRAIKIRKFVEW